MGWRERQQGAFSCEGFSRIEGAAEIVGYKDQKKLGKKSNFGED